MVKKTQYHTARAPAGLPPPACAVVWLRNGGSGVGVKGWDRPHEVRTAPARAFFLGATRAFFAATLGHPPAVASVKLLSPLYLPPLEQPLHFQGTLSFCPL